MYIGVWDYSQVFHCCIAWIGVRGNVIILLDFASHAFLKMTLLISLLNETIHK